MITNVRSVEEELNQREIKMIEKLKETLEILPKLLSQPKIWDSLLINLRKPHTYRVFTKYNDLRICLHKFNECDEDEAFAHPHPWPGAFIILEGSYKMKIGHSIDRLSKPIDVAEFILNRYSMYEITSPLTWHSVIPLEETWTVMINGDPWPDDIAHIATPRTRGKDLGKMNEIDLEKHLNNINYLLHTYNYYNIFGEEPQ